MRRFLRPSSHVSLAAGSALLVLLVIGVWLLAWHVDGASDPALLLVEPDPPAVALSPPSSAPAPSGPGDAQPRPPAPQARYALESEPLASAAAADHLEERLNRLGYATVRFRAQDAMRVIRYGQFEAQRQAQAVSDELARTGIKSRVVKVR